MTRIDKKEHLLFKELDVVKTKIDVDDPEGFLPKGTEGTVVHAATSHVDGKTGYYVEFQKPQLVTVLFGHEISLAAPQTRGPVQPAQTPLPPKMPDDIK